MFELRLIYTSNGCTISITAKIHFFNKCISYFRYMSVKPEMGVDFTTHIERMLPSR